MADQIDIEQIVREVLARLNAGHETTTHNQPDGRLELRDRLVTLATLENRLTGVQTLVLARGAVVTPSARDQLRERGVQISHAASTVRPAVTLVLGVADMSGGYERLDGAILVEGLAQDHISIEHVAATGLTSVVVELADHVARNGRPAVLFTSVPEVAACLANRHRGVRAVAARDLASTKRAIGAVAANFLAVDAALPKGELLRAAREFCAGWPRTVPAIFDVDLRGDLAGPQR